MPHCPGSMLSPLCLYHSADQRFCSSEHVSLATCGQQAAALNSSDNRLGTYCARSTLSILTLYNPCRAGDDGAAGQRLRLGRPPSHHRQLHSDGAHDRGGGGPDSPSRFQNRLFHTCGGGSGCVPCPGLPQKGAGHGCSSKSPDCARWQHLHPPLAHWGRRLQSSEYQWPSGRSQSFLQGLWGSACDNGHAPTTIKLICRTIEE